LRYRTELSCVHPVRCLGRCMCRVCAGCVPRGVPTGYTGRHIWEGIPPTRVHREAYIGGTPLPHPSGRHIWEVHPTTPSGRHIWEVYPCSHPLGRHIWEVYHCSHLSGRHIWEINTVLTPQGGI